MTRPSSLALLLFCITTVACGSSSTPSELLPGLPGNPSAGASDSPGNAQGGGAGVSDVSGTSGVAAVPPGAGGAMDPGASTAGMTATGAGGMNSAGAPAVDPDALCPALLPEGELSVSLEGTWQFTPGAAAPTTIEVPGGGWLAQGFGRTTTRGVYERALMVPDLGEPQATWVEFGAVNHQATLSLDGNAVATTVTSFTPARFDLSAVAIPGTTHALSVEVVGRDDPALRVQNPGELDDQTQTPFERILVADAAIWSPHIAQGIFRSARVRVLPALYIADAFVRTDVQNAQLSLEVQVTNAGSAAADANLSVTLSSFECEPFAYPELPEMQVAVPAGQTVTVTLGPVAWDLGPDSYWWPNVPYQPGYRAKLHYAAVRVASATGAGTPHLLPVRFGFRQIQQVGTRYVLNGVPVNFRGDSLQGANYDAMPTAAGGTSDAFDLVPGFLPPSGDNPGWPGAVDNYQRLNYNVSRIHQEPASPYMLDVADELGFMLIGEVAIRGTEGTQNGAQDFIRGQANMLAHARDLVLRDRNHPSIIRWSQANEAEFNGTNSQAFELALFQTLRGADDTRPVCADSGFNGPGFDRDFTQLPSDNFAVFEHYPDGLGAFTETFQPSTTRPFGIGELGWPLDNQPQGLLWFATSTAALRVSGVPEIRPYTLLSGWVGFVPGVRADSFVLEQNPANRNFALIQSLVDRPITSSPLFGADNLSDPFSNPILTRIQRAFHPLLVLDVDYWEANGLSNANGDWPSVDVVIAPGGTFTRSLLVFNDTFAGTAVDVSWELHTDSPSGPLADQGQESLTIPLGGSEQLTVTLTAPASGTRAYLLLRASKNGQELFFDDAQVFALQ